MERDRCDHSPYRFSGDRYYHRGHGDLWRKLVPDRANYNDLIDANRHELLAQHGDRIWGNRDKPDGECRGDLSGGGSNNHGHRDRRVQRRYVSHGGTDVEFQQCRGGDGIVSGDSEGGGSGHGTDYGNL